MDAPDHEQLDDFDLAIVGRVVRLEIPLHSPSALRQVADLLRGLANQCEFAATDRTLKPRTRMFELMSYARAVNRKLKSIRGRGRPRTRD